MIYQNKQSAFAFSEQRLFIWKKTDKCFVSSESGKSIVWMIKQKSRSLLLYYFLLYHLQHLDGNAS